MEKIIIVGLLLVSCNQHQGQFIDEGVYICTSIHEDASGCKYTFKTKHDVTCVMSGSGKWQIGDTL